MFNIFNVIGAAVDAAAEQAAVEMAVYEATVNAKKFNKILKEMDRIEKTRDITAYERMVFEARLRNLR